MSADIFRQYIISEIQSRVKEFSTIENQRIIMKQLQLQHILAKYPCIFDLTNNRGKPASDIKGVKDSDDEQKKGPNQDLVVEEQMKKERLEEKSILTDLRRKLQDQNNTIPKGIVDNFKRRLEVMHEELKRKYGSPGLFHNESSNRNSTGSILITAPEIQKAIRTKKSRTSIPEKELTEEQKNLMSETEDEITEVEEKPSDALRDLIF